MDPDADPGGPKTYGSGFGSGSATLPPNSQAGSYRYTSLPTEAAKRYMVVYAEL